MRKLIIIILLLVGIAVGLACAHRREVRQRSRMVVTFVDLPQHLSEKVPASPSSGQHIVTSVTPIEDREAASEDLQAADGPPLETTPAGAALNRILQDPTVEDIQVVRIDLAQLDSSPDPRQDFGDSGTLLGLRIVEAKVLSRASLALPAGSRSSSWLAKLLDADGSTGDALIVWRGDKATGLIRTETAVFTLRPLEAGLHVLTTTREEVSEREFDDFEAPDGAASDGLPSNDAQLDCSDPLQRSTIDLMVLYTPTAGTRALDKGYDIRHSAEQASDFMNTTFDYSRINGAVRLVLVAEHAANQEANFKLLLDRLVAGAGEFDDVHAQRKQVSADVVILVVHHDNPTTCGRAATIGAVARNAYVVVNWQCMTDKYSFAHEIGHLAGAWHDPDSLIGAPKVVPPFAHGLASTDPRRRFATVMAYRNHCAPCGRIWHWSNPENYYHQVPTGTADRNNNACVWRQSLARMSRFGEEIAAVPTDVLQDQTAAAERQKPIEKTLNAEDTEVPADSSASVSLVSSRPGVPSQQVHLVRQGENLSMIAAAYFGRQVWKRVYQANVNSIRNPNLIYPGQRFIIPLR